jgi:hypothetical protein
MIICYFDHSQIKGIINAVSLKKKLVIRISKTNIWSSTRSSEDTLVAECNLVRSPNDVHTFDSEIAMCVKEEDILKQLNAGKNGNITILTVLFVENHHFTYKFQHVNEQTEFRYDGSEYIGTVPDEEDDEVIFADTPKGCKCSFPTTEFKLLLEKISTIEGVESTKKSVNFFVDSTSNIFVQDAFPVQKYRFTYNTTNIGNQPPNATIQVGMDCTVKTDVFLSLKELKTICAAIPLSPFVIVDLAANALSSFTFFLENEKGNVRFRLAPKY